MTYQSIDAASPEWKWFPVKRKRPLKWNTPFLVLVLSITQIADRVGRGKILIRRSDAIKSLDWDSASFRFTLTPIRDPCLKNNINIRQFASDAIVVIVDVH